MAEEWVQAEKTWHAELDTAKLEYQRLIKSEDEHANILRLLKQLPKKVEHQVMVPIGPMAFMPGKLVHTNEKRENQIQLNADSKPVSDDEDVDEDDDEGQGAEFWRDKGFVGCYAYDDDGDEQEEEEVKEDSGRAAMHKDEEATPWNDDEPVMEIIEPLEGGEPHVVKYASQKEFEDKNNFSLPPELKAIFENKEMD
ncbi:hypothetical protein GUITHDRAFT_139522 [Guillardia theta CCMP2712]|uniref:Uncharacterized protein n=1 Tax=Guillardia theta (strain CCMP2712) TaxID=905079 RepID=L1J7R5_GUITC|nr:hypothetical protein GUITHDRAFT_139522 [Guillardia theta CCMP2712]EKX44571.1 hypothetical protein GUITHDRAFT_139522 [Guillardia theta CCMP2712]|eukprot:XP_005831551.1 hypothetical protein GUITHDRAFT_139522 [Guillardia theta CCMP2712]